ncbi:hypothetical protein ABXH80_004086 [Salmonella enterica]|nr:hypothetical protein [Salmonella enterica]
MEMVVLCDYCGKTASLVYGSAIYPHRPDLYSLNFWMCSPCNAWVGCHKNSDGKPLGRLANSSLRAMKSSAHRAFDPLWKTGRMSRKDAYLWLSKKLGIKFSECHIGMFDEDMCEKVVELCK